MSTKYWIKLYHEMLDDPKVAKLEDSAYRRFVECLLLAGEMDEGGFLPPLSDMAWRLRLPDDTMQSNMTRLALAGLVELREYSPTEERWFVSKFDKRQAPMKKAEYMRRLREERQNSAYYSGSDEDVTEHVTNGNADKIREDTDKHTARASAPPSPPDETYEMAATLEQVVKNRKTTRNETEFMELAQWLVDQGATSDGLRAFAAWFGQFDDAPWLTNVRNEWGNYTNGRPPSFAGKSRAKRNGANKHELLDQLKMLARKGTTGYTTETKPQLEQLGLMPYVERMGRWADVCRLPLDRFDIEFFKAWNEVHA